VVLELQDRLVAPEGEPSALGEVEAAHRNATEPGAALQAALIEIRMRLKLGEYARVRRMADSVLDTTPQSVPTARVLAPLAALVGRGHLAARLLALTAGDSTTKLGGSGNVIMPRRLGQVALRLWVYAAMGGPADSLQSLRDAVEAGLAHLAPSRRAAVRLAVMEWPAIFSPLLEVPAGAARAGRSHPLVEGRLALAANRRAALGAIAPLVDGWMRDPHVYPSAVVAFPTAEILLAAGDTANARTVVARSANVRRGGLRLLASVEDAAMLVRCLVLRARLEALRGHTEAARESAEAVRALWAGAELPWRQMLETLRDL
jgi:hypothetical protein